MSRSPLAMRSLLAVLVMSPAAMAATPQKQAARQVDRLLTVELIDQQTGQPAPATDDETFLRRVHLDLVGVPPTPEEVIAFTLDPQPGKRDQLVTRLLADPRYGGNWAGYWRDVVFYRRSEDRAVLAMLPLQRYLTEQLNKNTPWNELARDFITAQGDVREDGRTALIMAQGGRPEDTVAEISRIFMGIQIQCAQCHDHPSDRWKREQFHELAAFFPRVAVRPSGSGGQRSFSVVADDLPRFRRQVNNNNRYRGTPEHYMPDLDDPSAQGQLMRPVFFASGQQLSRGAKDAERRKSLADWITAPQNPWFARSLVNRIWAELVGEGFYEPVDDMGPDREPMAPQTLDYLQQQFVDSGYDLKWLFRTVMATDAYQRASRDRRRADESPFLASCAQRLRADQLYNTLSTVLGLPQQAGRPAGRGGYQPFGNNLRRVFNRDFGYDPSAPREEVAGSIPQALLLMNAPLINQAISAQRSTGLGRLLAEIEDNESLVVELYLRALSREPTDGELKTCLTHVAQVDSRGEAFEDILWALVNSTEFLHRR